MKMNHPKEGRFEELIKDPHVIQATERAHEALKLTMGTREVWDFDSLLREVANQVSILEVNPDLKNTWGGVLVTNGPMDGYSVYVRAADIYKVHMAGYFDRLPKVDPHAVGS